MNKKDKKILKQEIDRVKRSIGPGFILSNDYAADLVNNPTPFTFSILNKVFSYEGSAGEAYKELGIDIDPYKSHSYVVSFLGRFYLNLKTEEEFLYKKIGFLYTYANNTAYLLKKYLSPLAFFRFLKYSYRQGAIIEKVSEYIAQFISTVNDWRVLELSVNSESLDFDDAVEELKYNVGEFIKEYKEIYKFSIVEEIYHQYVKDALGEKFKEEYLLATGSKINMYKKSVEALDQLADGSLKLDQFIEKYGMRSFNDFEFSEPRWLEQPDNLVELFANRVESTSADYLHRFGLDPDLSTDLGKKQRAMIETLREMLLLKDNMRFFALERVWVIRKVLLRISEILSLKDLVFYLDFEEIISLKKKNIAAIKKEAVRRKEEREVALKIPLPNVITPRTSFEPGKSEEAKAYINGVAVSPGYAQGELLFINNPLQKVSPGMILVLPTAGPEYAHLYNQARGVIFQKGGMLSHGAILTREFRVPAIVSSGYEKMKSWEGSKVTIEADKGRVTLMK